MTSAIYQVGISGMRSAQIAITTTGHNIANVNTPGYTRQSTEQSAEDSQFSGEGFIGKGVKVEGVRRVYDEFLVAQLRDADTRAAGSAVMIQQVGRLSGLLGDESTGMNPVVTSFFSAVNAVSQHPGDPTARNALLSSANTMTGRLQDIDTELQRLRQDTNLAIDRSVVKVNTLTKQIAEVNDKVASLGNSGQAPNDLLDLRDELMRELGKNVRLTVTTMPDNTVNVFLGSGQPLVLGNGAYKISTTSDPQYASDRTLQLQTQNGTVYVSPGLIGGGELVGQFDFRDGVLNQAQNEIGRFSQVIAQSINEQHRLGQDRNGALGTDFYASGSPQTFADSRNTGTAAMSATVTDATQLAASDYEVRWDGANYIVRRLSDGTAQSFGSLPQTVDGVQFSISGAPTSGDAYRIVPSRLATQDFKVLISDPARVAAASPVRSAAAVANTGSGTITQPTVIGPTVNANLQQPVTITFTGAGTFDVNGTGTGNPTGVAYTPGGAITYNGWTLTLDGAPKAGDTFSIQTNVGATGDNGNMQRIGSLQTSQILRGETLAGAYGSLVADIANEACAANIAHTANTRMLNNAEDARQSLSGVNLDEEAANLVRYQAAYQAAAKFTAIVQSLFESMLQQLG